MSLLTFWRMPANQRLSTKRPMPRYINSTCIYLFGLFVFLFTIGAFAWMVRDMFSRPGAYSKTPRPAVTNDNF